MLKEIGLIGLGVMGKNIALNLSDNGVTIKAFNNSEKKLNTIKKEFKNDFIPFNNLEEFVENLENPKTLVITAGFDPLSDEGEEYAALLNKAGVDIEHIHYPNMFHGFVNMTKLKAAKYAAEDFLKDYKKIL